ncbi:hypothetical protein [Granulicella tundricola]|uniref:Integral membrane protein n=1 Tax=Granulicella tundricola (strain ATCC BAA-1859 / DSM 23138 / MP5ACTX9) TaxID=1198114 RepID=E8X311_GRATM|nr:hypothetical protein [Granulicella tundricola]ADW68145.1 hypothetical protein AciX9_1082 [Granulicella tundricola MP5ACTX9]
MNSHHYLAAFFAGLFLANAVPHYVAGISGNRFPTPFAKPPGKGLSSAPINTVWALANLVAGFLLFRVAAITMGDTTTLLVFFTGIAAISIQLSMHFTHKHAA